MAILSFPLNWRCFGDCHHLITEKKIRDWTLHIRPTKKIIVPMYTIKHRIRYFIENMKFPPSRIIYFFKFYRQVSLYLYNQHIKVLIIIGFLVLFQYTAYNGGYWSFLSWHILPPQKSYQPQVPYQMILCQACHYKNG